VLLVVAVVPVPKDQCRVTRCVCEKWPKM
jgi:hypothetical protein